MLTPKIGEVYSRKIEPRSLVRITGIGKFVSEEVRYENLPPIEVGCGKWIELNIFHNYFNLVEGVEEEEII